MTPELIWIVLGFCSFNGSGNYRTESGVVYSSSTAISVAGVWKQLGCEKVEIYPAFAPVSVGTGAVVLPTNLCEIAGHDGAECRRCGYSGKYEVNIVTRSAFQGEGPRCSECEKTGRQYRVFSGLSMTTLMGYHSFYDENHHYHRHDPNTTTTSYRCSNGHEWSDRSVAECPYGDYPSKEPR